LRLFVFFLANILVLGHEMISLSLFKTDTQIFHQLARLLLYSSE